MRPMTCARETRASSDSARRLPAHGVGVALSTATLRPSKFQTRRGHARLCCTRRRDKQQALGPGDGDGRTGRALPPSDLQRAVLPGGHRPAGRWHTVPGTRCPGVTAMASTKADCQRHGEDRPGRDMGRVSGEAPDMDHWQVCTVGRRRARLVTRMNSSLRAGNEDRPQRGQRDWEPVPLTGGPG
jgi:hypothetical protein